MLDITIPGYKTLRLEHAVFDYNGTLACDGQMIEGVKQKITTLSRQLQVHVITADTFGSVKAELQDVPCRLALLPNKNQAEAKRQYVESLDAAATVTVGNGRIDRLMIKEAALGIVVAQEECAAVESVLAADVVAPNILAVFDLLLNPLRLVATLRS